MKIATYNILKGGSQRIHWIKMIEDFSVDLLLVQESYAHHEHLPPLLYPDGKSQSVWKLADNNKWGSAIFSRYGSVKPLAVKGFTGWVVGAEITGPTWPSGHDRPLMAFSIHAPARGEAYWKNVNNILFEIKVIAGEQEVIIGGDFNLTISNWSGSERPVSKQDLAIQARLGEEFGLINCWQTANPDQPLHQTLRWSSDRTIPYHCDGLFVPMSWRDRLESCTVLSGEEWNRLSDHNPVIACFS